MKVLMFVENTFSFYTCLILATQTSRGIIYNAMKIERTSLTMVANFGSIAKPTAVEFDLG
jgi:hypothetical protein